MRLIPSATRTSPCAPARAGVRTGAGVLLLAALGGCMTIGSPEEGDGGGRRPAGHQVSRDAADPRPEGAAVPRAGDGHGGGRRGPARKDDRGRDGGRSGQDDGEAGNAGEGDGAGRDDRDAGDRDATRRPSGRTSRPADAPRPGRTPTAGGSRPAPSSASSPSSPSSASSRTPVPSSPAPTTPPAAPSSASSSGDGPGDGPDNSLAGAGMNDGAHRVHSVYAHESADSDRLEHHLAHRPEEPRTDSGERLRNGGR
ncbi:hypothetical protein V1L54_20045 [Streptomyces sp. TRM 70361]|uniref:hypothetical protein n=1 Tax=Streptomyces sp. TRM 70361 TaxID=3116553 RepID=UPI002E7C4362|nr:hypothetical protein [Streptomyces sp. TRM 70361]MEE1941673.1 hypothetical protein [Streptomyces sp. TRM 70361]